MAEESLVVRGISWRHTFPFVNLFRAFRVAVHPSKLVLALVALILLYAGGHLLDLCWAVQDRAVPDEVALYEQFAAHGKPGQKFAEMRQAYRDQIEFAYEQQLLKYTIEPTATAARQAAHDAADLGKVKNRILADRTSAMTQADQAWTTAYTAAAKLAFPASADAHSTADHNHQTQARQIYADASTEYTAASRIKNLGIFDLYFDYESNQVSNVVRGVREWNWFGEEYADAQTMGDTSASSVAPGPNSTLSPGVIQSIVRFFAIGPIWLMTQHPLYFVLFGCLSLVLWSIFGGAICRIAAVHVARDEKLSIRSALMFSGGKFLSFLFAPIIPLMIVVVVGGLVTAGSALANIPWLGPIIVGIVFILALAGGFVMSLVLLGLIGGFNLMYPTVAVEGSDSFDAISRSFSYLYARPWRLGFYTIVSVVYGAATYIFVRMFIFLMLVLTHKFAGLAILTSSESTAPLWTSLWPNPATSARLSYDIDTLSLNGAQEIGARMIWLWVHLVIAILGAFAVCFYFSANTIIYYLMRREVDATDLDDVYLELVDDEFAEPVAADVPATGDAPVATTDVATPPLS